MTTRERFREQVRDEVKAAALEQLRTGGATSLSVNAIAKELGVSGPALYRYFANRDELLTALVLDAYDDLAAALEAAPRTLDGLAGAYRAWALAQPHRYRLLYTEATPGYDAHQAALVEAAQRSMRVVLEVLPEAQSVPAWVRLHGFVMLEINGNFASMGLDADALFQSVMSSAEPLSAAE